MIKDVEISTILNKPLIMRLIDGKEIKGTITDFGSIWLLFLQNHQTTPKLIPLSKIKEVKEEKK